MPEIKITVSGKAGAGKTTFARIIAYALQREGFRVVLSDEDEYEVRPPDFRNTMALYSRYKAADEPISIITETVNRNGHQLYPQA